MVREREREQRGWVCHLCTKINPSESSCSCACCGRPRDFAVKSISDNKVSKALMLHGDLSTVARPEQVHNMVRGGIKPDMTSMVLAELGYVKCVEVLLQHTDVDLLQCVDRSGATAIQLAHFAHQSIVYELLYLHQSDSVLHDRMLGMLLTSTGCTPHR
ncbi:hypothetical protein B5M09_009343 [Aphanomyces astaci]|uniref:RanBP2-type domain-containing protein n=1 Tax=Aphanomyces astaci TaxID=112090 RepID=A0A3R7WGX4_APHAT|nr:hypothetical protein B5M09_009343 [Aphanomyces astaci]